MHHPRLPTQPRSEPFQRLKSAGVDLRALVVDHDTHALQRIAAMLNQLGFVAITAHTRAGALVGLITKPHVVLVDVAFGEQGGTFSDGIRIDPEHNGAAIIAMARSPDWAAREKAVRWSNGFLSKPFTLEALSAELLIAMVMRRRALRKRRSTRASFRGQPRRHN